MADPTKTPSELALEKSEKTTEKILRGTQKGISKTGKAVLKFGRSAGDVVAPVGRQKRIFGKKLEQQSFTREQEIMRSMFGGGGKTIFDNRKPREVVQIDKTLLSGGGISPLNTDRGTQDLMMSGGKNMFFFGGRK